MEVGRPPGGCLCCLGALNVRKCIDCSVVFCRKRLMDAMDS
jgi:hypothetical protein